VAKCDTIINLSVTKMCEEFLDHLGELKLFKKGYAPWNHSINQSVSQSVSRPVNQSISQ